MISEATATRKTKSGLIVTVKIEQGTREEKRYLDGYEMGEESHVVNRKKITISKYGETLTSGKSVSIIAPQTHFSNYDELIASGAVASVGNMYISQNILDLVNAATEEAETAVEKTDEQIKIETAKAEMKSEKEAWKKSPEGKAEIAEMERYDSFVREMEREDSDF